jgi:excinuclease ABC subunit C
MAPRAPCYNQAEVTGVDREEQLKLLPDKPGCYLFKDERGRLLYVGKARSLKSRVRQYFQSSRNLEPKVIALAAKVAEIDHIVTDNEVEALILESNLIKRHRPKYNIRLRDDKHYPYLRLTLGEKWPRLLVARAMRKDGSRYFGPYTTSSAMWETMKLARRIFPLRTCSDPAKFPKACLQYHIGRCLGPCLADFDRHADYDQAVRDLGDFLEGRSDDVVRRLKSRMEGAAENLEFERAAELRDQLRAVEKVTARQKIISGDLEDLDAVAFARGHDEAAVQVFFVRQGKLIGRDQFLMAGTDGMADGEVIGAFLQQQYTATDFVPKEILVSADPEDRQVLEEWLSRKRGARVQIRRPQRGEKRELIGMVAENAREGIAERRKERERELEATLGALEELQRHLDLPSLPYRIECFDISHVQGSEVVAALVVFERGAPKKEDYRRFKMRTDRNDDFANMAEAVTRRFKRGLAEREAISEGRVRDLEDGLIAAEEEAEYGGPGPYAGARFAAFPDLVIIDGGKGQLSAAREAMRALGVDHIETVGLAKEEELLFKEGEPGPVALPRGSQALFLVQRVRDEAHRFAITYHRKLHRKAAGRSTLDDVPGIGPKRKKALLRTFGSLKRIREATVGQLAAVEGMNREAAERVLEYLGGQVTP